MSERTELVLSEELGFAHVWQRGDLPQTFLLLHGTGGDEHDLLDIGRTVAHRASLLSPRGKVLEGGRYNRFFRRLAEGIFDEEDIKLRAAELAGFIRDTSEKYEFDAGNVWALGFSNGANIAAALALLHPGALHGAVLLSPMTPLVPDEMPHLNGLPVFIGAGEHDPVATPAETHRLADLLARCGAQVTARFYPGGHGVGALEVADARAWVAERICGAAAAI